MCVDDIRRCRRHQSTLDVESSGITGAAVTFDASDPENRSVMCGSTNTVRRANRKSMSDRLIPPTLTTPRYASCAS